MTLRRTPLLLAPALLAILAACTPSGGSSNGELQVNLTATGISPAPTVTVSGPNSVNESVTGNGKNIPLAAGTYTVTAQDVANYSVSINDDGSAALSAQSMVSAQATKDVEVIAGQKRTVSVVYTATGARLTVNIVLPSGVSIPSGTNPVTVSGGPSGTAPRNISSSQTLTLPIGSYTTTANPFTVSGTTYSATVVPSTAVAINASQANPPVVTVTYVQGNTNVGAALNPALVAGESLTLTLTPTSGTPTNITVNGPASSSSFPNVPAGNYTLTGRGFRAGTVVDTVLQVASANVTVPGTAPALSVVARGYSGRMFVAGNGAFSPAALNASYALTDAQLGTSGAIPAGAAFLPSTGTATDNIFRIAFDPSGNAYMIVQASAVPGSAQIIRISEANLRAGGFTTVTAAAAAAGNVVIASGAFSSPGAVSTSVEPADLAFDQAGNLWVANDAGGVITCISAASMNAAVSGSGAGNIANENQSLVRNAGTLTGDRAFTFQNIHTLAFDRSGNLWFVSDGFIFGTTGATARRSRLSRVAASALTCSGGEVTTTPDITVDFSNGGGAGGPVIKPVAMALDPSGDSFWIADFGGSFQIRTYTVTTAGGTTTVAANAVLRNIDVDADINPQSVVRVNIAGLTTGTTLQPATFLDRVTVAVGTSTDRGMRQPFGLAFDKQNRLWVATNNNVEATTADVGSTTRTLTDTVTPANSVTISTGGTCTPANVAPSGGVETVTSCLPATALTDRLGKVYRLDVGGTNASPAVARALVPSVTLSAPTAGTGFVGLAFNTPPANAPVFIRPQ